jgi:hypothetical protein
MFIAIVLLAIIIGILFFVVAISLIVFIYNLVSKNAVSQAKSLKVLIPSLIIWVLLIGVDVFLLITYLQKNGEQILDKSFEISSDLLSRGMASTLQGFERNWDKQRLEQLENLDISMVSIEYEDKDGREDEDPTREYTIGLVLKNNSPAEVKLYFGDLLENHYLVAIDTDNFAYGLWEKDGQYVIVFGESKCFVTASVGQDVTIDHVRYKNEDIRINN